MDLTNLAPANTPSDTENILNGYKSVTYNFTLAALPPDALKNPKSYRNKPLKYVVASSKGKKANAISSDITTTPGLNNSNGADLVKGFNDRSGGRFDLFIDSVELDSIITPNEQTGTALSTKVKFEVFEPYSANGFIEALYTAAVAAGWSGYLGCCYLLKIEFLGYSDKTNGPMDKSEVVNATKYIPMKLTGTEMEVNETGTKYRVSAIPYNEAAYANPNQILTDMSFTGNTVKTVLEDLFASLEKSLEERERKEKPNDAAIKTDKYEIYFPEMPAAGEELKLDKSVKNEIAESKINEVLRESAIYKFPPIEKSPNATPAGGTQSNYSTEKKINPETGEEYTAINDRSVPTTNQIQFAKGANISEIVELVIRDSEYVKDILKDIDKAKSAGANGMIDYFQLIINTVPLNLDDTTGRQRFTYQYIVAPYKVHFSKLPGQQNAKYNAKDVSSYVKRTYDYLYTGKNVDVLGFKLNFNNLFFQAAIPKQGATDKSGTSLAAGASNEQQSKLAPNAAKDASKNQNGTAVIVSDANAGSISQLGGQYNPSPYTQLAIQAHSAILESVNLITGEIEIIGDPYYLSTSGMGNYSPVTKDNGSTQDGEARPTAGPVIIRVNFRNPIDIDEKTGLVTFSDLTPFSGIYQVLKCRNTFRDGTFKQSLNIMRFNGQIIDTKEKPTKAIQNVSEPTPGEQQVVNSKPSDVSDFGAKPNDINLGSIISRGFPQTALAATVSKALASFGEGLKLTSGIIPSVGISSLTKNINISALPNALSSAAGSSALFGDIGKAAASIIPGNPGSLLNSSLASSVSDAIGGAVAGASNLGLKTSLSTNSLLSTGKSLLDNPLSAVSGLGNSASSLIGGIGDKVKNLSSVLPSGTSGGLTPAQRASVIADATEKGIPVDQALKNAALFGFSLPGSALSPAGLANKLGINPAQISGLSGKLDSNVTSNFENLAKSIPENVNLKDVKDTGIIMANLAGDSLENLPAMPLKLKAPAAALPARSVASALTPEQRSAVIADATEKGIPIDQALRNASVFGINIPNLSDEAKKIALSTNPQALMGNLSGLSIPGLGGGLGGLTAGAIGNLAGADAMAGKLSSMQKNLGSMIPSGNSVEGALTSVQQALGNPGSAVSQIGGLSNSVSAKFGSLTASAAGPLDKLMNNSVNKLNDPNAPAYTGTDPIVRRRLGLPPIDEPSATG
jgi:hypothetical protein